MFEGCDSKASQSLYSEGRQRVGLLQLRVLRRNLDRNYLTKFRMNRVALVGLHVSTDNRGPSQKQ